MNTGQKVRVYRNVNRKVPTLSVQTHIPGVGWRVTAHMDRVALRDVTFDVSHAGWKRVMATKRKNVHAFVVGTLIDMPTDPMPASKVGYNPYRASFFTNEDGSPATKAHFAVVYPHGVFAS